MADGKSSRKIGRNGRKPGHVRYANEDRWKKNKVARIVKHILKFPKYKPFNLSMDISDKVQVVLRKLAG